MNTSFSIERVLLLEPNILHGLAEVTLDVVEDGASVGFMHPFSLDKALKFWEKVKQRLEKKEILLLVAKDHKSDKLLERYN
jgi:uncharacterized protein (DUF1919 family)